MTWVTTLSAWGPVLVWMAVIFAYSSRHRIVMSSDYFLNFLIFKTLHICEYGFLYLLTLRAFRHSTNLTRSQIAWRAFVITMLYSISDEFHQTFVPTREGVSRDVIIDGIGVSIIWYFQSMLLPIAPKKLRSLVKNLGLTY